MRKSTPGFEIHVDSSCLSDPTNTNHKENEMSPERISSNQTVVHHASCRGHNEEKATAGQLLKDDNVAEPKDKNISEDSSETEEHHDEASNREYAERGRQIDRIEAQIQAAARAVVASMEQDHFMGNGDSELSMRTEESYTGTGDSELSIRSDESYEPTGTDLAYNGTALSYDGTEATHDSDHDQSLEHEGGHSNSHHDGGMPTYELDQHSEHEGGDSSSHHDGDIDDDVFSHSDRSGRSSLDSCHELNSDDNQKLLTSPAVGEEASSSSENDPISRIPSVTSYMHLPADSTPRTPSKVLSRPPFRTPSSVRAMQMSSPTPSIFSSPRSTKRHLPTVSRIGTPTSHNRTPTRLKPRKDPPLVLLHVTVLPLQWPYSHLMSAPDIPESLHGVKDSWRLLQEKLGDTVLERGILLPHPQDSYEILEERLLEALELPVHPRVLILKCGHYIGPSEDETENYWNRAMEKGWCDICQREVRIEEVGEVGEGERKFRVKIYASNGLMRAGAWAAAWKEMERVDVEIEPFVEGHLGVELEHLATMTKHGLPLEAEQENDDGFVDESMAEDVHEPQAHDGHPITEDETLRRKFQDEERLREIYGHPPLSSAPSSPLTPSPQRPVPPRRSTSSSRGTVNDDSLPDLLLAAFKVAMRDKKNLAIVVLSLFVLILSLRPGSTSHNQVRAQDDEVIAKPVEMITETMTVFREATATVTEIVPLITSVEIPLNAAETVDAIHPADSQVPTVERLEISDTKHVASQAVVAPTLEASDIVPEAEQEKVICPPSTEELHRKSGYVEVSV